MGSFIEINDTLRITKKQGFPGDLDINQHLIVPYHSGEFEDKVYHFSAKPKIRVYHRPPVRNFLVEDINGKWVYWGLVYILRIEHDYVKEETSGTFKIIHINSPEEMKQVFQLVDRNPDTNFFEN